MRWLAVVLSVVLVAVVPGAPAAAPGLVELKVPPVPVVVAVSDEPDDQRHLIEGKVRRVRALGENVFRIVVGGGPHDGSFQVGLPPRFKLPIRVGATVRAELWVEGAKLHARVTDGSGAPLVFMNELPDGWTMKLGARTARPPRGPRQQHVVEFHAPGVGAHAIDGWVRGRIGGATYRIYAEGATLDAAAVRATGSEPTWSQSIWSSVLRETR